MASAPLRRHLGRALLLLPPSPGRAARFVATTWLLAITGIWAVQLIHADLHEHVDLAPHVHLMRDGSLAVPFAAIALALAGVCTVAIARLVNLPMTSIRARLGWAVLAAFVFAVLSIPGNELHATLFGAEEEEELSWLADAILDGSIVLAAALVALVPAALIGLSPWPPEDWEGAAHRADDPGSAPADPAFPMATDQSSS